MALKDYVISLTLVMFFGISLFLFVSTFESANQTDSNINQDNNSIDLQNNVQSYIINTSNDFGQAKTIFYNTTPKEAQFGLIYPSQSVVGTKIYSSPYASFQYYVQYAYVNLVGNYAGNNGILAATFSYMLTVAMLLVGIVGILYIIKFVRQGEV